MVDEKKKGAKREGPAPAHILLDAISRALAAGVARAELLATVNMARKATGVKQAPGWRMCAESLDEASELAQAPDPGGSLTDVQ